MIGRERRTKRACKDLTYLPLVDITRIPRLILIVSAGHCAGWRAEAGEGIGSAKRERIGEVSEVRLVDVCVRLNSRGKYEVAKNQELIKGWIWVWTKDTCVANGSSGAASPWPRIEFG